MKRVLLSLALLAAPLAAQAPVATDPAALAAARDLMAATDVQGQMRSLMPQMAAAMGAQLRRGFADEKVPEGLQREVTAAIQANLATMPDVFTPDLINRMAAVYARLFTVDDLRKLTALMRDPVMLRFRRETPNTMGEIVPILLEAMQPRQQAFQARMKQIVADWIRQHPEDKAKLRSPIAS